MAASAIPSSLYIFVVQNGYQYLLSDLFVDLLQTWYLRPMFKMTAAIPVESLWEPKHVISTVEEYKYDALTIVEIQNGCCYQKSICGNLSPTFHFYQRTTVLA